MSIPILTSPYAVAAPNIHINTLWLLVLLFTSLGTIYFVLVFLVKRRLKRKERDTIVLKKDIAPLLSTLLFKPSNGSRQENEDVMHAKVHVRELIKNPEHRKKVSEILIDIQPDLPDHTRERIMKMYQDFGLHEDAIRRLNSWRWEVVCRGINELTQMQVTDAYIYIRKYINDSRSIVRKQAQLAMVALKPEGINHFLDLSRHEISEWQQLKLIETLKNLSEFNPPSFRLWLTSKNKYVVLFAIRLIRSFNQNDAFESILKLVKHRDDTIKIEAIHYIRDFNYQKSLPLFKAIFWNCKSEVKLALLNAIGALGSKKDIPFLRKIEQHSTDFVVKNKAVSTINALAPETILPTEQINESLADERVVIDIDAIEDKNKPEESMQPEEAFSEFQDAVSSPEFQQYSDIPHENDLQFDLIYKEELKDIQVVVEHLHIGEEENFEEVHNSAFLGEKDGEDRTERSKNIEPIKVDEKSGDTPGYFMQEDTHPRWDELIEEIVGQEEGVYHMEIPIDITDHSLTESRADEQELQTQEDADALNIIYDMISDVLGPINRQHLTNEYQLPKDNTIQDWIEDTPDFKLESYPARLVENDPSQDQIWSDEKDSGAMEDTNCSVFESIFHTSSLEIKLALLEDILQLGDAREIPFLRKLRNDKSEMIRRAAERTLALLTQSLQKKKESIFTEILEGGVNKDLVPAFEIDMDITKVA